MQRYNVQPHHQQHRHRHQHQHQHQQHQHRQATWEWGGNVSRSCKYRSTDPAAATGYGANATCEPLVPAGSATVVLSPSQPSPHASSANASSRSADTSALADAVYVDTRTTVYTTAPPVLTNPRKYKIKVAAVAGIDCCVPPDQVNSSVHLALEKIEAVVASSTAGGVSLDVVLLPEEFMCGTAECAMELETSTEIPLLQVSANVLFVCCETRAMSRWNVGMHTPTQVLVCISFICNAV